MKIGFKNNLQFIIAVEEVPLGNEVVWKDAPANFDQTVQGAKLENDVVVVITKTELDQALNNNKLRILRTLPREYSDEEVLHNDYTIGTKKTTPDRDRGRKVKAEYIDQSNDDIIVDKTFQDVQNGELLDLQVTHNWYREDGTIGLSKTEIVKSFNKTEAEKLYQDRRIAAISFLVSEVRGTVYEPYINSLMDHYSTEIDKYISPQGADDFEQAILNETDPTILAILQSRVPFSGDNAYTIEVKNSILYQIHSIDQATMLASLQPA